MAQRCQADNSLYTYHRINTFHQDGTTLNCYGFVAKLLQDFSPNAYEEVVKYMHGETMVPVSFDGIPCPFNYTAFFTSLIDKPNRYWTTFNHMSLLMAGDIIVYLPPNYQPQEIDKMPVRKTGTHMMVVESVRRVDLYEVELTIIDCTRSPHCVEDSRKTGGVGKCPLTISQNGDTYILQWGTSTQILEKDLFFGRLIT